VRAGPLDVVSEGKTDQAATKSFLFDENGEDRAIDSADLDDQDLNDRQLLWVDLDTSAEGATNAIPRSFAFDESLSDAIADGERVPMVRDFEDRFRVRLLLPVHSEGEPDTLDCVVGGNWVVTAHPGELDLLDRFMEPLEGETDLGRLAAPRFLALLLDAVLDRYFAWIDDLERRIDRFDEDVIGGRARSSAGELLSELVSVRHAVHRVRRTLAPHREVFTRLAAPEFQKLGSTDSSDRFRAVADRLERAMDNADTVREMVMGSFELVTTQTAQRTNDIMKRLTLISAVLLPAVVLAGVFGMNFHPSFFDRPEFFFVAIGLMAMLGIGILAFGRWRRWL
jgi:magnesium transporter